MHGETVKNVVILQQAQNGRSWNASMWQVILSIFLQFIVQHWWMMVTREDSSTSRKMCPSVTLSTTNSTWTGLGLNPGLDGEGLMTVW